MVDSSTSNLLSLAKLYGISAEELLQNVEPRAGKAEDSTGRGEN